MDKEYTGVCELLWIRNILRDLGIEYATPMNLYCDNKVAIQIAQNPVQHDRTKHVEVDRHFIKENLDEKIYNSHLFNPRVSWLIFSQIQF